MKISRTEIAALRDELITTTPSLATMRDYLINIATRVLEETGRFNADLETRIAEAGKVPGDVVVTLMIHGAMSEIVEGLPDGNMRRELVAAGRVIGKFMARKYREKIAETMTDKMGGN